MGQRKRPPGFNNDDGIEFVCCRICGDYRRVISGRHLSKHDTDRETYLEEYHLSPDELDREWPLSLSTARQSFLDATNRLA